MKFVAAIFFALILLCSQTAHADTDQVEAREVARINNCTPKKIDVYQQSLGPEGSTTYRVDCTMAKTGDNTAKGADALLISCKQSLCELLRPLAGENK
jgi:hypothetical protein